MTYRCLALLLICLMIEDCRAQFGWFGFSDLTADGIEKARTKG